MSGTSTRKQSASYQLGDWSFEPNLKQLTHQDGTVQHLEDKISSLLSLLCERRGELVSREEILENVWEGKNLSEQTVPVAISKIRKALGEAGTDSKILHTVPKRGYRLSLPATAETSSEAINPPLKWRTRLIVAGSVMAILLLVAIFWPKAAPYVAPADAGKPGIILTVKDIRTSLESQKDNGKVIALSELASFYLSQIPEVLVIRHWWNVDAPDPTGGIFTRYGPDTPVFLLKGSLIEDAGNLIVTLFLSDPRTDEVIWSGVHPVADGSGEYFKTLAEMFTTIGVLGTPQARGTLVKTPSEDERYWVARYLTHLSGEGAATRAQKMIDRMLADDPANEAARHTATALAARWPSILEPNAPTMSTTAKDHVSLVDQAVIHFYKKQDIDKAMTYIEKALSIAPGDHYALSLKAEILIAQGLESEAFDLYKKAARLAPFAISYEERMAQLSQ